MSMQSIQALLLLSTWPSPVRAQVMDPSWNLSGHAIAAATFSSLNETGDDGPVDDWKTRTWLACFLVNTTLSTAVGASPLIRAPDDLSGIAVTLHKLQLPGDFGVHVDLQRQVARLHAFVVADRISGANLSIISMLEHDLDLLRQQNERTWSDQLEIMLQKAKLVLFASTVVALRKKCKHSAHTSMDRKSFLQMIASKALQATVELIGAFSKMLDHHFPERSPPSGDQDYVPPNCMPKFYMLALVIAVFFLPHYWNSPYCDSSMERSSIQNHIRDALHILRRCSRHPTDEPARAAAVLDLLSSHSFASEMQVDNRQAASFCFDGLRKAAKLRGRPSVRDEPIRQVMPDMPEQTTPSQQVTSTDFLPADWFSDSGSQQGGVIDPFDQTWGHLFFDTFDGVPDGIDDILPQL
ncbi:hypothetical protein ANO11243_092240 [Dothideomycetidae sp. 11243]|nr:hypothetical protein ANO11243_092240 [fungal sp. No.11243]